jgi:hypothetical protein
MTLNGVKEWPIGYIHCIILFSLIDLTVDMKFTGIESHAAELTI